MIFLLFFQMAWASVFQPLPVVSISYVDIGGGASCSLLKHRAKERRKVIRESIALSGDEDLESLQRAININFLISNQYFFDRELGRDETVNVHLVVQGNSELRKLVESRGLGEIYFSIQGTGIRWIAKASLYPKDTLWSYDSKVNRLEITYSIYKADLCFGETESEVQWAKDMSGDDWPLL